MFSKIKIIKITLSSIALLLALACLIVSLYLYFNGIPCGGCLK